MYGILDVFKEYEDTKQLEECRSRLFTENSLSSKGEEKQRLLPSVLLNPHIASDALLQGRKFCFYPFRFFCFFQVYFTLSLYLLLQISLNKLLKERKKAQIILRS